MVQLRNGYTFTTQSANFPEPGIKTPNWSEFKQQFRNPQELSVSHEFIELALVEDLLRVVHVNLFP